MKRDISRGNLQRPSVLRHCLAAGLAFGLTLSVQAASLRLANEPLANATVGAEVLPNLLISFDDSGSMTWIKMPDWVGQKADKDDSSFQDSFKLIDAIGRYTGTLGCSAKLSSGTGEACSRVVSGGVATGSRIRSSVWNLLYYDPSLRYDPPAYFNADGSENTTTYLSMDGMTTAQGADSSAKPNWRSVPKDRYGTVSMSASYKNDNLNDSPVRRAVYVVEAGEYCSDQALRYCKQQSAPDTTYKYPARLRFCKDSTVATSSDIPADKACQAIANESKSYLRTRYPEPRESSFNVNSVSNGATVNSIKVAGQEILSASVTATSNNTANMANALANRINECNGIKKGNCAVSGFAATVSGSTIRITAGKGPDGAPWKGTDTLSLSLSKTGTFSTSGFSNFSTNNIPGYNLLRIITPGTTADYPYPGSSAKAADRTDCAGTRCTGNEEMTNYANWYAYYHYRVSALKTAMSLAFKDIQPKYRIGLAKQTFTSAPQLQVGKFEGAHKKSFYDNLFGMPSTSNTPTRRAHANAGKYFAKKLSGTYADPMQYFCQANYVFLATDGYWNDAVGTSLTGTAFNPANLYKGAEYYYTTDLRRTDLNNCSGSVAGEDVCKGMQRMGTFGMALGSPGELVYQSDYKTATTGDYVEYNLKDHPENWPDPGSGSNARTIDDLWHATDVSGGEYFSAKNPKDVVSSLKSALLAMDKKHGSGSAAASSSLQPTSGDNYNYVASYATVEWKGNLEARFINLSTGATSESAAWCVEDVAADSCSAPSTVVPIVTSSGTTYVCRPPVGNDVEVAVACTGKLKQKVGSFSDTRTIFMRSLSNTLVPFNLTNIAARGLDANYSNTFLRNNLGQRVYMTEEQLDALNGEKLVAFLRGQKGYEKMTGNLEANLLFRLRAAVLGDIIESQPNYRSKPNLKYKDSGYDAYKSAKAGTPGTVYVGANDGMLHAFDGATGIERWAFVPSPVIPNLWRLADEDYPANHRHFVNGSPVISDIYSSGWKTILVAGLNGGGRGYFALDITDPTAPSLLWEFTAENDSDLGFTYGNPVITKLENGQWVVLVTSGYNNGTGSGAYYGVTEIANNPAGSGRGYLYVLNAGTGAVIRKISTGVGSASTPSGLSKIAAWADEEIINNTAGYVYGGDLFGNLWRFDINNGNYKLFAQLRDGSGTEQPITARPELGKVDRKRVVFAGTGKYLEVSDLSTKQTQSVYAIMDKDVTLSPVRPALVQQVLSTAGGTRTITNNAVDFSSKSGWYFDLPDSGERQYVNSTLVAGLLLIPTTVPESSICEPGGYGWLNYVNYRTGGQASPSDNTAGARYDAPIVGTNIFYIDGKPVLSIVKANDPTPTKVENIPFGGGVGDFRSKKAVWRELIQ